MLDRKRKKPEIFMNQLRECEGSDLGGQTCESLGFAGGHRSRMVKKRRSVTSVNHLIHSQEPLPHQLNHVTPLHLRVLLGDGLLQLEEEALAADTRQALSCSAVDTREGGSRYKRAGSPGDRIRGSRPDRHTNHRYRRRIRGRRRGKSRHNRRCSRYRSCKRSHPHHTNCPHRPGSTTSPARLSSSRSLAMAGRVM